MASSAELGTNCSGKEGGKTGSSTHVVTGDQFLHESTAPKEVTHQQTSIQAATKKKRDLFPTEIFAAGLTIAQDITCSLNGDCENENTYLTGTVWMSLI